MKVLYIDSTCFENFEKEALMRLRFIQYCQDAKLDKIIFSRQLNETAGTVKSITFIKKYVDKIIFAPHSFQFNNEKVIIKEKLMVVHKRVYNLSEKAIYLINESLIPNRLYFNLDNDYSNKIVNDIMKMLLDQVEDNQDHMLRINKMKLN
ncbi:MAG: hypothetical protein RSC93_09215 [Erysipelotrichaceae bacterium]